MWEYKVIHQYPSAPTFNKADADGWEVVSVVNGEKEGDFIVIYRRRKPGTP